MKGVLFISGCERFVLQMLQKGCSVLYRPRNGCPVLKILRNSFSVLQRLS